ncbi:MAG: hypothetical protein WCS99_10815 [Limisphaerales bacterium]
MSVMSARFPAIFAAEMLPPEFPQPGGPSAQGRTVIGEQSAPILISALLVTLPLALWFSVARRRHRKRAPHRPRNPTLAETGGLPPPRQP